MPGVKFYPAEIRFHRQRALMIIGERAEWFSGIIGVKYNKLKVSSARRRWGSCNSRGNISFTWRLILVPPQVMDYVVVHELTHLLEMNHSPRFWRKVEQVMPEYRMHKRWLRENQHLLEV